MSKHQKHTLHVFTTDDNAEHVVEHVLRHHDTHSQATDTPGLGIAPNTTFTHLTAVDCWYPPPVPVPTHTQGGVS